MVLKKALVCGKMALEKGRISCSVHAVSNEARLYKRHLKAYGVLTAQYSIASGKPLKFFKRHFLSSAFPVAAPSRPWRVVSGTSESDSSVTS